MKINWNIDSEKENLSSIYENEWERFRKYAINRCIFHDILVKAREFNNQIYEELGLGEYTNPPELTIGSTVKGLAHAAIFESTTKTKKDEEHIKRVENLLKIGSLAERKKPLKSLKKVFGGRNFNAQPIHVSTEGVICDSDMKGAYATALASQVMPLGKYQEVKNITLKEYLEQHHELAYHNLEFVLVTVGDRNEKTNILPEAQNFIPSCRFSTDKNKQDEVKVYSHEIFNAPFTTSTFRWLNEIATVELREYIKNYGQVIAGIYYDKNCLVSLENLNYELKNLQENKNWIKVDLGKNLIEPLKNKREENPKEGTDATPMTKAKNSLFKLYNNTVYGVFASSYFSISNPVVANNITSDVRLFVWMMEVATGGYQTITDGVSWNLNKVVYKRQGNKRRQLNSSDFIINQLRLNKERKIKQEPIGKNVRKYEWKDFEIVKKRKRGGQNKYREAELLEEIDKKLLPEHMISSFKSMKDFIERFTIESKGLYKYIATSGSSDYAFERVDGERVIKKRSHDPKKAGKEVCEKYYFEDLRNPTEVRIPEFYITYEILKCGEYGQRYESNYQYSRVVPGDKIPKVKYVRIFTLNQFLFQTEEQYDRWKKEDKYARNSTGLSAERYDYDWDTDSVNLEQMLKRVDAAIAEGSPKYQRCNSIKNYNRHIGRVGKPYKIKEKLDKIREQATRYFDYPDSSYIIKITPDNQR